MHFCERSSHRSSHGRNPFLWTFQSWQKSICGQYPWFVNQKIFSWYEALDPRNHRTPPPSYLIQRHIQKKIFSIDPSMVRWTLPPIDHHHFWIKKIFFSIDPLMVRWTLLPSTIIIFELKNFFSIDPLMVRWTLLPSTIITSEVHFWIEKKIQSQRSSHWFSVREVGGGSIFSKPFLRVAWRAIF